MILSLDLPIPPSVNNLFGNRKGGRYKTQAYREWIKSATASLWTQKPAGGFPFFPATYTLSILLPSGMRGDIANREKALSDFLKTPAGIISDDRHAASVALERSTAVSSGMCRVTVSDTPPVTMEAA